jgi:enamine deaminase RidA (YjgF/YER057c/UK114 family)
MPHDVTLAARRTRPIASRLTSACLLAVACSTALAAPLSRYGDDKTVYATGVKTAAGAPLYFSAGLTAGANAPADMKGQALATLKNLADNIAAAGLKLADVAFVRAYLAPGPDGSVDYAGWNAAWAETFGTAANPVKPARTTVAVPLLGRASTLIEIEYVCSAEASPALFPSTAKTSLPAENANLKVYGSKESRIASGVGIAAGAGLYWTAGTLAALAKPEAPANTRERHGDMKFQAVSTLTRLKENLAAVGLSFKDVVFLRAFVAPDKLDGDKFDLANWNAGYDEFFNRPENPHKPARATVTTPTFGGPGPLLEVELVTAYPGAQPAAVAYDASKPETINPNLKAYGAAASPISSGIAVKPGAALYFSAGAVPSVEGDMKTQALSALESLKGRMADAGVSFKDVIFLRAYVVPEANGDFDRKGWSEAYSTYFNTPTQTQKPARTTIPVHSLPRPNWKIEIDVIAAQP